MSLFLFFSLCICIGNGQISFRCRLPSDVGICCGIGCGELPFLYTRYYYNGIECVSFSYAGCGGNDNNFITKVSCQITCVPGFTYYPSISPSVSPSNNPTTTPTLLPSNTPTLFPSQTQLPTLYPSTTPNILTFYPTIASSSNPSIINSTKTTTVSQTNLSTNYSTTNLRIMTTLSLIFNLTTTTRTTIFPLETGISNSSITISITTFIIIIGSVLCICITIILYVYIYQYCYKTTLNPKPSQSIQPNNNISQLNKPIQIKSFMNNNPVILHNNITKEADIQSINNDLLNSLPQQPLLNVITNDITNDDISNSDNEGHNTKTEH